MGQQGVTSDNSGAWNGGGAKGTETLDGSGGGATDIRTKVGLTSAQASSWSTSWNNNYGLRSRIMVAAGGGGSSDGIGLEAYDQVVAYAGNGGGLTGGNAIAKGVVNAPQSVTTLQWAATGGTQNAAGTCGHAGRPWSDLENVYYTEADFGQAGYGCNNWGSPQHGTDPYEDWGSAGGGWYGGGNIGNACGGGGSSYIGGVSNGTTISGGEIIPVPVPYVDEDTNELITNILGRKGDGYARITLNRQ